MDRFQIDGNPDLTDLIVALLEYLRVRHLPLLRQSRFTQSLVESGKTGGG